LIDLGAEILNTVVSAKLSTCSEVSLSSITAKSLSKSNLYDEYKAIKLFLSPMVGLNVEITVLQGIESTTAVTQNCDSWIDLCEETAKSVEEFRPIPPVRSKLDGNICIFVFRVH